MSHVDFKKLTCCTVEFKGNLAHISSVAIFLFKMKRIYSLNNILEIPKKSIGEKLSVNDPYETQSMTAFTDVFEREFPFCDVSQGQIGKSLFLEKGIPFSRNFIV